MRLKDLLAETVTGTATLRRLEELVNSPKNKKQRSDDIFVNAYVVQPYYRRYPKFLRKRKAKALARGQIVTLQQRRVG
jgi:hypothetical protein